MTWILIGVAAAALFVAAIGMYCSTLRDIYREKLATDEAYLVTTRDLWKIRVCRYRKGRTNGQPVLLVHGASVNQHNFTSPRGGSLVDFLVDRGFDCWTVDLRGCRSSVAPFERHRNQVTIDDYLNDDIPTVIQFIKQETGYARVHYCGHSMGGMLLYAYVLKFGGEDIASAVTLGSPLGFEGVTVKRSGFLIAMLSLYPPFYGGAAQALVPLLRPLRLNSVLFPMNVHNLAKGLDSSYFYMMLEDPLPGVLRDMGRWVSRPGWTMDGGKLDVLAGLKTLDIPLFALFAQKDPFVPVAKAREFFDQLPSTDKRLLICSKEQGFKHDYNHCDLAFPQDGAREVYGPIARWFETHAVRERLPIENEAVAGDYQTPLDAGQRAGILSGESFAHLSGAPVPAAAEAPVEDPAGAASKKKDVEPVKRAAARTSGKSPDLSAVSAALTALRPLRGAAKPREVAPIKVKAEPRRTGSASPDTVETPASVLKALSNASGALEAFKESEKGADTK